MIGLLDEVLRAEDIIRNKYIKTICYDTHQICTPGKYLCERRSMIVIVSKALRVNSIVESQTVNLGYLSLCVRTVSKWMQPMFR